MIENSDILSLNYYKSGQPFSGSFRGMRYRIEKLKDESLLKVSVWPEPFSYEKTDEELKKAESFDFSEDGKAEAVAWLNRIYEQEDWSGK